MTIIDTNTNTSLKIDVLRQRRVTAVGRYYRVTHPRWRLTPSEARKLSANGIKIFTVYEDSGRGLELTRAKGKTDGTTALSQARDVGQPPGSTIYFAAEGLPHGYTAADLPAIRDYFEGVAASIGGVFQLGVYSDGVVCAALLDEGVCAHTWLSASTSFAGTKQFYKSGRWSLAQKTPVDQDWDGLSVDVNEAKPEFGGFFVADI